MQSTMKTSLDYLARFDPEIAALSAQEYVRQAENLELIASENIASPAVIAAMASALTNKYAEGLPGRRYYGGCTPARRPIWRSMPRCCSPAIRCSAWICRAAAT